MKDFSPLALQSNCMEKSFASELKSPILSGKNSAGKSDKILVKWQILIADENFPRWTIFHDD